MRRTARRSLALALLAGMLAGCAHNSATDPIDPLESFNRKVFVFNMTADKYIVRPIAVGYRKALPQPVRTGIYNFFDNLFYPRVIIHDLLQGKFKQSGMDLARFAMNTTFGLAGLFDVASDNGLPRHDEDLGQTLGAWGVGEGWYLMLPLLGPSTNRDVLGFTGDTLYTDTLDYIDGLDFWDEAALTGVDLIDKRSRLLDDDKLLEQQLDPYVFMRSAYLQKRQADVRDGKPPEDEFDYGIDVDDVE